MITYYKDVVLDTLKNKPVLATDTNGKVIARVPLAGTKVYYVADSSGGAVTRKLTFVDGILTAEE